MPQEAQVEFPIIVTLTLPDGHGLLDEEMADLAWQVVAEQYLVPYQEDNDGQPVLWIGAACDVDTEATVVDGRPLVAEVE